MPKIILKILKSIGWLIPALIPYLISIYDSEYEFTLLPMSVVGILICIFCTVIFSLFFYKVLNDFNYRDNSTNKKWVLFSLIPCILFSVVASFIIMTTGLYVGPFYIDSIGMDSIKNPAIILFLVSVGFFSTWTSFYFPGSLIKSKSTNANHIPDFSTKTK